MASLRTDTGLDEGPSSQCKLSDSEASLRTGEWVSSGAASAGPSFTGAQTEAGGSLCTYHDISAFRELTQLHQGRHSTVWSAVCQQTGRTVVIKGYNRDSLNPRQLHNVRREISLLRFFRDTGCKGVVSLLATFEDKSVIYLVFEACMRGDLYQLLMRNRGTLHEEFVVTKIVYPLLSVLQQLHKLHIIHRDIKPENIFITEDGDIALGDFGLAGHKFQDRMTERVGTLDYMAPEVLSIPTTTTTTSNGTTPATGISIPTGSHHDDQQQRPDPDLRSHHLHDLTHDIDEDDDDARGAGRLDATRQQDAFRHAHTHAADGVGKAGVAGSSYDEKVDIWATGVLVFELLVGRPPFEVDDARETAQLIMTGEAGGYPVHISQLARDFVAQALTKSPALRPSAEELLHHGWLRHHFGGKVPDPAEATSGGGGGMTAGLLKSWLVATWSELSSAGPMLLRPHSNAPNRLFLSPAGSPRQALSIGEDPCPSVRMEDVVKSAQYARKSIPIAGGVSDGSNSGISPREHEMRKQQQLHQHQQQQQQQQQQHPTSLDAVADSEGDRDGGMLPDELAASNRLAPSQYPSRDSSTGSMDQAVPMDRSYIRNDSGASASSGISIASFASLQHVPRSNSVGELGEQDELGMVQRSVSICPANISRMAPPVPPQQLGAFPNASTQLKPVWQSPSPAVGIGSRKTPGKSRFAA